MLPYWEGSLPRSCNCPLNGLYVLKPHGRSSSLRRAFRSWEYARRAASENAQSTNLAIISSSVVCISKRARKSLGTRIDGMSCLRKENNCRLPTFNRKSLSGSTCHIFNFWMVSRASCISCIESFIILFLN